jgi:DNA-binding response OmpR family regulator
MGNATLLLVESKHAEFPAFAAALRKKNFIVSIVANGSEALNKLADGYSPDVVVINAATLRTSGKRICQSVRESIEDLPVIVILSPDRADEKVDASVVLTLPFTAQKLVNRIRHLLPPDGKNVLQVGPIRLDTETGVVRCLEKKSRLTPRLVHLLTLLIKNRGVVMERKGLFSKTWETNYTDDTRTLDVHISWLRHAIEDDPSHPRFLKTIRGVGYRLDV